MVTGPGKDGSLKKGALCRSSVGGIINYDKETIPTDFRFLSSETLLSRSTKYDPVDVVFLLP